MCDSDFTVNSFSKCAIRILLQIAFLNMRFGFYCKICLLYIVCLAVVGVPTCYSKFDNYIVDFYYSVFFFIFYISYSYFLYIFVFISSSFLGKSDISSPINGYADCDGSMGKERETKSLRYPVYYTLFLR